MSSTSDVNDVEGDGESGGSWDAAVASDNGTAGEAAGSGDESGDVYDFKDPKATGVVTVIKQWDDSLTNGERPVPDISISTEKPSKSALGYTVTFHGNGLTFEDGSDTNEIIVNSSGEIVSGQYKVPAGTSVTWYSDMNLTNKVEVSAEGIPEGIGGDMDLYAKEKTFVLKGYHVPDYYKNGFAYAVPDTVTEIIFTDEVKPSSAETIDVDADGDGGVVAWLEDDTGTIMKVSTQIKGRKVEAAKDSGCMFEQKSNLKNIDFTMLDTSNVTSMSYMFYGCSGLTCLDLSNFDTRNVTSMEGMFSDCSGFTSLDVSGLDTGKVEEMDGMFSGCSNLVSLDLSTFDTSNAKYMGGHHTENYYDGKGEGSLKKGMFEDCKSLTSLNIPFDTRKVRCFGQMFKNCVSLKILDISTFSTGDTASTTFMFAGCTNLTQIKFSKTDKLRSYNMNSMFAGCREIEQLDVSAISPEGSDMIAVFYGCRGLKSLDLSSWDTSNAYYMNHMFYGCTSLINLNLTGFNTKRVGRMDDMFASCSSLKALDLSSFDTSNVTNMSGMFYYCSGLTELDLTPLKTGKVTSMSSMFNGCYGLTKLDLSHLDTGNVIYMYSMFQGCSGLTELDLSHLDTSNVTDMSSMFSGCSGLTKLDLSSFNTGKVTYMNGMFYKCSNLTALTLGEKFAFVGSNYYLPSGTWYASDGAAYTSNGYSCTIPNNTADTYTRR